MSVDVCRRNQRPLILRKGNTRVRRASQSGGALDQRVVCSGSRSSQDTLGMHRHWIWLSSGPHTAGGYTSEPGMGLKQGLTSRLYQVFYRRSAVDTGFGILQRVISQTGSSEEGPTTADPPIQVTTWIEGWQKRLGLEQHKVTNASMAAYIFTELNRRTRSAGIERHAIRRTSEGSAEETTATSSPATTRYLADRSWQYWKDDLSLLFPLLRATRV